MNLVPVLVAAALLVVCAVPTRADMDDVMTALDRGDTKTATREVRGLAEQGVAGAQYILGRLYKSGFGLPQDFVEAEKWLRRSSEQGLADAQVQLGKIYEYGLIGPKDYDEAAKWFRKAAGQGQDEGQYNMCLMYEQGWGVPRDYVRAYLWCTLSADQEKEISQYSVMIQGRLSGKMTFDQIKEARRLAREWTPKGPKGK